MTIYSVNSEILYEAPLTEGALIKYELMGDYYIELPFDAGSYIDIPRGSYIDHEGTRYTVMENILPEPKDEGGYHYAVKFWAGQSFMKNRKLFWLKGANKESSFHITTTIDQFGQLVVDNMNEFMTGKWELSSLLPADALTVSKTISFEGDSCWDAVSSIAEAYGIEWWVHHDEDTMELHFGKLEGGNLVDFKVGEAITSIPSQKGDDSQYGTRFYVYGSNQNLPEGYGDTEQGGTVHHVSNPRLMLPSGIDYIDAKRNMTPAEIIEQVVIFEDVYPKNTDTVTAVTTVQRPIENAAEGQPQTFTAYQLIAANTPFLPSDVMENETLRLVFNSGALTGVEFEVDLRDADDNHIDPFKWKPEDGFIKKFELIAITEQVGDMVETLPDERVHPVVGDEFVLLGVRLSDDKVREAEEELLQRGEEWKDEHSKDTSVYNCPTNPVYCKRGLLSFALGQRVRLYDPRFDGGYRDSRIQGFEKRIWNEYIATYTIGDNAAYTRIGAVESSVTNLKTTERTIGMILDELASTAKDLSDMFEMVEYNKTKMIRANYDFFSIGGITAGGIGSSSGGGTGGGGSSTLSGLNDVALKSPISSDVLVYNGSHWTNTPMSSIKPDLTDYATKSWVEGKGYALNTALLAVNARLENVETIFEADQDGAINKWGEVVAFLDGIEGDTLDSILAQFATIQWVENKKYITADTLEPYALKTAIPTKNSELENDAEYITAAALNSYATQNWVEDKKYLDGIDSTMVINALGYTPYNAANFTKANIKSALGISDWALASAKPTYQYSEIQGIPDLSVYFLKTSFTKDNIKTTLGISDWALAASKPSYKWSEINERPTNLSQFTDDVVSGKYLPIGGTAADAAKLGGEEPDHYATAAALSTLSKAVTEFRSLFDSFFEKDTANNAIKAKLSLYSLGGITAGGIGSSSGGSGGGGSTTLAGLNDVALKSAIANDMLVYNGTHWVNTPMSAIKPDLTAYATKSWVEGKGYITASSLDPYAKTADVANTYATQTALQGVDIRVQAIEYIFEKDQDGVINKWQEIVDFLAGVEGTTLDAILDQFATKDSLAGYLPLSGGTLSGLLTIPEAGLMIRGSEGNGVADRIVNQAYSNGLWGGKDAPERPLWSIRNAFAFDWYNDRWIIGAVRYGDSTSAGFGVGLIDTKDDGTIYQKNLFRIDKNGEIYQNGVALANKYLGINAIANLAYGVPAVQNHEGLGAATYGNYGGFVQSAMGGPSEGTWYSRLKVLHGNSKGYYQEIAMPFLSDDLYYRRMSEGVLNDWVKIPSENSLKSIVRGIDTILIPYTDGVVPSGWHRVAVTTRGFNHANNIRLKVARMWNNNPSEAFVVDISACYGKVVCAQVSGCAYDRLIDKIRVVGKGNAVAYVDLHFKSANTNVCTVSVRGTANILSTIEYLGDTDVDNQYVFSIIDGAAFSDAVTAPTFIGNLQGNADSATKLQTPRTLWGQSFDGTGNVDGPFRQLSEIYGDGELIHKMLVYPTKPFGLITRAYISGCVSLQSQREDNDAECFKLALNPLGGNVGIGTTNPAEKLDVAGNIKASGSVRIGDAILDWDATNKCVTIKNANTGEKASLFVDGGVTGTKIN